ncbi:MAG: DUF4900 domain-containing protein [Bacteroidetes bacterium]|nr:DUF4900 domain-containing protein [Bacteroidota bacterium]MCL5738800.1 DUF4900 domain-containing protein [Bacteroidota bacterium]
MVGKGTLLVILGFSLIFGLASQYWNRMSNQAVDNFVQYYDQTAAHNIAVSAANIALNSVFMNPTNNSSRTLPTGSFYNGYIQSLTIDSIGQQELRITAVGRYEGLITTVQVKLGAQSFSEFALYTSTMSGVYWASGDTVGTPGDTASGAVHSEDSLNVIGSPVFYGRVTSKGGLYTPRGYTANPIFYGQYQRGVSIPMPTTSVANVQTAAGSGGAVINNPNVGSPFEVYMTFSVDNSSGTPVTEVTYHTTTHPSDTTVSLSSLSTNGVIMVNNGNLHVHGTVNGQVTVGATTSTSGYGNVYINGNVMCNTDPRSNPNSTDAIGIVALNNVTVESDNAYKGISPSNPPVNPTIEAAIFAQNGKFSGYYKTTDSYKNLGAIHVFGSITNYSVGATSDASITYGYNANYKFDKRFANMHPPSYPITGKYQVLSWYE